MYPIKRTDALIFQVSGDALIGGEHEFFNDAVSNIAFRAGNALHQAMFIELNQRFGQIEIDRTPPLAFAIQDHGELAHGLKQVHQAGVALAKNGVALEHGLHIGIGHAFR